MRLIWFYNGIYIFYLKNKNVVQNVVELSSFILVICINQCRPQNKVII